MKTLVDSQMMITDRTAGNEDGLEMEVAIEGYIAYHEDIKYGADADGNRGTRKIVVDDVNDVVAWDMDGEDVEITDEEKERAEELLIQKFLEG